MDDDLETDGARHPLRQPVGLPGYHGPSVTTLAANDVVHLHTHSEFSLLDGLGRITDMVDEAGVQGFDSLGITEIGRAHV